MTVRALFACCLAMGLAAQPAPPPPPGHPGAQGPRAQRVRANVERLAFLAHHLKLTEAQREQIKAIHTKHQEAIQAKQRSAMEARESLHKAASRSDAVVADLRTLHQAAAEARAVLTPEQRAESDRLQALGEERRQFRMERMRKAMERGKGRGFGPGGGAGIRLEGPGEPFED